MINSKILNEIIKDIKNVFKTRDKKKFVLENLPYLLFFYIGNIFASHVNSYVGGDIIDRILVAFSQIDTLKYIPSLKIKNLIPGLILLVPFLVPFVSQNYSYLYMKSSHILKKNSL